MANKEDFCPEYGVCKTKMEIHEREILDLKSNAKVMEGVVQDMKVQQIKDGERIITLFNTIGEIKDALQQINSKLDQKRDSFKDFVVKFGTELIKAGIIGGLLYYGVVKFL